MTQTTEVTNIFHVLFYELQGCSKGKVKIISDASVLSNGNLLYFYTSKIFADIEESVFYSVHSLYPLPNK